jgi:Family of unknown function (DUF5694)
MKKITRLFLIIIYTLFVGQLSFGQKPLDPDNFLIPNKDSLPKILLVGTFHFEYYNGDAYKVDKSNQTDILAEKKQKELKQLLDYISLFKPTKIFIEALPSWNAMKKFRNYRDNKKPLNKDERMQIGFRLAEKFKLDTLYSIDVSAIVNELVANKDSNVIRPYFDTMYKDINNESDSNYTKYYDYDAKLQATIPLLDYFKYLNSPKVMRRDFGSYLLGDFKKGEYNGADVLAFGWYDRNLRIFRNIQKNTTSPNDRILVLYGSGHVAILDQLLSCSPQYNYVKFGDLKK